MNGVVRKRGPWLVLLLVVLLLAGPAHAGLHPGDGDCPSCHAELQEAPSFDYVAAPRPAFTPPVVPFASAPAAPPLSSGTTRGPPSSTR